MPRLPLFAAALLLLTVLSPVQADDLDESRAGKAVLVLLEKEVKEDPRDLWLLSTRLAQAGKPAIAPLRGAAGETDPARRLAIGRALLLLEDYTSGLGLLREVVLDEKASVVLKRAAIRLVGDEGELEDAEWLEDRIDRTFEPRVKMAMAKALWALNFRSKKKGKEVLLAYLRSTDPDLRAEGALALGEIGAISEAKPVLQKLREEPTERGRSAAFLLRVLGLEQAREQDLRTPLPEADEPKPTSDAGSWPLLDEILTVLRRIYVDADKVDQKKLEDAMAAGITRILDPYTNYLSPEENAKLLEGLDQTYAGVGAYVHNDPLNRRRFTISQPIFGGPLYRAGIRSGDIVISIDGTLTDGLSVEEAVRLLKGPPGTDVTVSIYRRGWEEPRPFTLKRARITIPTTAYEILPGKIGFLRILSFSQETSREVAKVLAIFQEKGVRAVLLDLRMNTGGYLHSAVQIASQFLPEGKLIVSEKGPLLKEPRTHLSRGTGSHLPEWPMAVLMDSGTASAAEILAGALQAHDRAHLIGTMTYGKGSVQRPIPLETRPGEPYTDQARPQPSTYNDANRNGRLDPGERVFHELVKNERYDPPESFVDANGNSTYDEGETFTDVNHNRTWDDGEPFEDHDKNGMWSPGGSVKVTTAAYYLPDGTRLERKVEVVKGKIVVSGGIEPDTEVKPEWADLWVVQAQQKLESTPVVQDYVKQLYDQDPVKFKELAHSDSRDASTYPGFDAFYEALDTPLEKDDVRFLVRRAMRDRLSSELGRELVGEIVEDIVIRHAVRHLFELLGDDLTKIPSLAFLESIDQSKDDDDDD